MAQWVYLTFSRSLFTSCTLTSASSRAAHTSLSIAPRTCVNTILVYVLINSIIALTQGHKLHVHYILLYSVTNLHGLLRDIYLRGGNPGICAPAFDFDYLNHPWKFDQESGPQVGNILFLARRKGTKPHQVLGSDIWISLLKIFSWGRLYKIWRRWLGLWRLTLKCP